MKRRLLIYPTILFFAVLLLAWKMDLFLTGLLIAPVIAGINALIIFADEQSREVYRHKNNSEPPF